MLLVYQTGSVKIGEVVRYKVTYTPSRDRILPSPEVLHLRIKNTCAIALRAAFVHGPYTLSVAAYPGHFSPNKKFENPRRYGVPEFEPMLKAGGTWNCRLIVPENIRQTAGTGGTGYFGGAPLAEGQAAAAGGHEQSVSWIIEIASQVIFSSSAAVNYDILLARDEKSLDLGSVLSVTASSVQTPVPGRVIDFHQVHAALEASTVQARQQPNHQKGVYSRAVHLTVEDTAALWNKPELPGWDEAGWLRAKHHGAKLPAHHRIGNAVPGGASLPKKQKKVHLVILTHGLHSNLGADMLFLKESIDAGVQQAKRDRRKRKKKEREAMNGSRTDRDKAEDEITTAGKEAETATVPEEEDDDDDDDEEEVVVRGFAGNATKTEKGIKYLGKRLARYVLRMTYPDQPFLPTAKAASEAIVHLLKNTSPKLESEAKPAHKHSTVKEQQNARAKGLYTITSVSFIGHSLGGLVQTYAIAYIQKHSPQFFDLIKPINFIALASPFLGLNHENPLYVKFALDFGIVGRTGQDLGLTWRAPTLARNGWGALVSNLGENAHKRVYGDVQPDSKPLLRILPVGPAHTALRKFRNRTVYSNVVNDGIVPLRTSCLLFLDWQGLGRVEKARREASLVETVVRSGWAELTGANSPRPPSTWSPVDDLEGTNTPGKSTPDGEEAHEVPQPPSDAIQEDERHSLQLTVTIPPESAGESTMNNASPLGGFLNLFRLRDATKTPPPPSPKTNKIYRRSQTLSLDTTNAMASSEDEEGVSAPPRTTFFESAGDLLNPKLPSLEYLIDPSKRARTIFHDRIYHPEDIPPPPVKKKAAVRRVPSFRVTTPKESRSPAASPALGSSWNSEHGGKAAAASDQESIEVVDGSQMTVEQRIARAYHRDLSWRKVLVKLEPDAHNNVIVRRMFANAFGWPVIHHLVDVHFSDSEAARTRDDDERNDERAKDPAEAPDEHGTETEKERSSCGKHAQVEDVAGDEEHEARDRVSDLASPALGSKGVASSPCPSSPWSKVDGSGNSPPKLPSIERQDSVSWSDRDWLDSEEEDDDSTGGRSFDHRQGSLLGISRTGSPLALSPDPAAGRDKSWNWTEKIVGRGAASRPKSPREPGPE